jgi:hypothetical protein
MKTLTFLGYSESNLKASRTESYPVPARENRSHRRSGQPEIQLQEKALRSVKHRHQTSNASATSVRSIANLYFLERRLFW